MSQLKLREFRKKANLNQTEVANFLNISQSMYSRLERGESLANSEQILKLCGLFSCTPNDLFGVIGAMEAAFGPLFEED